MRSNGIKKAGVLVLALLDLQIPVFAAPAGMHVLRGHVIPQIQGSVQMGRVAADEAVDLSLVVKVDPSLMDQTYEAIYGQQGKQSGHFLSSAEFAQKFGLAEKRKRLKDFAQANGLAINAAEDRAESMIVKVSGRADQVEKTFSIQLNRYKHPDGRVFRAHATDPMIPDALAADLGAVMGLSNLTGVVHPHLRVSRRLTGAGAAAAPAITPNFTGSLAGAITPSDISTIYGLSTPSQNGAGQNVAIFELDGYNPADIASYESQFSLPNIPLIFEGVDSETNHCYWYASSMSPVITNGNAPCDAAALAHFDTGMVEVALDIEMVAAVAPNAAHIYVYDSANALTNIVDQYDRIATDNLAPVVSTSWGSAEVNRNGNVSSFVSAEAPIFQRMAVQGQAIYAASGDNGAFDNGTTLSVDDPASQPFVTGVGGTSLTGTPTVYTETAWSDGGGGISSVWPIPSYQAGVPGLASTSVRNVPDVALNADPNSGYAVFVGGGFIQVGGTSAAAPLWTALMALVNQQRVALGNSVLGFANPAFYKVGISAGYHTSFNDITIGTNSNYVAGPGYDNATGLGSYKGSELVNALSSVASFSVLSSLSDVYAYPNPWDIRKDTLRQITIANVIPGATVRIFTVSGLLVKSLPVNVDHATWDLTNNSGRTVASGLYIYLVLNNGTKTVGKIAIIK